LQNDVYKLETRLEEAEKVIKFYANKNHWMSITEAGDQRLLVAHGSRFDGTSNGWVEAASFLERTP